VAILPVSRINQQSLVAIQVWTANAPDIVNLFAALLPYGYGTNSQTDIKYPGYWRLTIQDSVRAEPQYAYTGEYILVTDATYTGGVWNVSSATDVVVYGVSTGQPSVADFIAAFTNNMALEWAGTPVATAKTSSGQATLVFQQPTSANGPFTYTATVNDQTANTTGSATISGAPVVADGQVTLTITGLTAGHLVALTASVNTQYSGVNATSAPSNTITIQ
jgi:hypothetical protein